MLQIVLNRESAWTQWKDVSFPFLLTFGHGNTHTRKVSNSAWLEQHNLTAICTASLFVSECFCPQRDVVFFFFVLVVF